MHPCPVAAYNRELGCAPTYRGSSRCPRSASACRSWHHGLRRVILPKQQLCSSARHTLSIRPLQKPSLTWITLQSCGRRSSDFTERASHKAWRETALYERALWHLLMPKRVPLNAINRSASLSDICLHPASVDRGRALSDVGRAHLASKPPPSDGGGSSSHRETGKPRSEYPVTLVSVCAQD